MRYFKPEEFSCQDGCGGGFKDMDGKLLMMLDEARGFSGVSYHISSAFRCKYHNKEVGGVEDSAHTTGNAVDIIAMSGYDRWKIINGLKKAGFKRIGISSSFIHADNDSQKPQNVIWTY